MTTAAPSIAQIQVQVAEILKRFPDAQAIGIRSRTQQSWPAQLTVDDRTFRLRWCDSPLAVRQLLAEHDTAAEGLVLLTSLSDEGVGADVLSCFPRGRLISIDSCEMLCSAFQARHVDFRLRAKEWIADVLLEDAPPGGYPPVPGGVLDAETAWRHLLDRTLGLSEARPDAERLLQWTIDEGAIDRFARLPAKLKDEIAAWLTEVSGPAGSLIVSCIGSGHGVDALPLGLVCGVVFSERWADNELSAAAVRLENYVGRRRVEVAAGRAWADAATNLVRKQQHAKARPWLERADALLRDLHIGAYAAASAILPAGFEARMTQLAAGIEETLRDPSEKKIEALENAGHSVAAHHLSRTEERRVGKAQMATRLVRWLGRPEAVATSFSEATIAYAADGSYVDWARRALTGGDENETVSAAFTAVAERTRERREAQNRTFAHLLKAWNASPTVGGRVLPVEMVLDQVVALLAQKSPLLVLVIDGLSYAVFRELSANFEELGWVEMIPVDQDGSLSAVAALPTVTEVSRASLLSGKLIQGSAQIEKAGFASHPALVRVSSRGKPPIVFHKAELSDAGGLSSEVREAIADTSRRIVGIVHNAVDDQLDGSDQLHHSWSLDDLRILRPVLREARDAGRPLLLTSDHGHVLDNGTTLRSSEGGDRWRSATGSLANDECEIGSGRVLAPGGDKIIVMPWSEHVRFGAKKNGYHGGATLQEVVVPLCVMSPALRIEGWKGAAPATPAWWREHAPARPATPALALTRSVAPSRSGEHGLPLFERRAPTAAAAEDWVSQLLSSRTYSAQRELASRGAPRDEDVRTVLEALRSRGGKMGRVALAQQIHTPLVRLPGLLSAVKRVLNVDQSPVLKVDDSADTVDLNIELLCLQFRLDRKP